MKTNRIAIFKVKGNISSESAERIKKDIQAALPMPCLVINADAADLEIVNYTGKKTPSKRNRNM